MRTSVLIRASVMLAASVGPTWSLPCWASTFKVNTTYDRSDVKRGDGICKDSAGKCSLRAAIEESNAHAGWDTIMVPSGTYKLSSNFAYANRSLKITDGVDIIG